jgi:hypothetical protein
MSQRFEWPQPPSYTDPRPPRRRSHPLIVAAVVIAAAVIGVVAAVLIIGRPAGSPAAATTPAGSAPAQGSAPGSGLGSTAPPSGLGSTAPGSGLGLGGGGGAGGNLFLGGRVTAISATSITLTGQGQMFTAAITSSTRFTGVRGPSGIKAGDLVTVQITGYGSGHPVATGIQDPPAGFP